MSQQIRRAFDEVKETFDTDFCQWAFGKQIEEMEGETLGHSIVTLWNGRHVEKIEDSWLGDGGKAFKFMEELWIKAGYPSGK